jgi:hypothetical protein
MGIRAGLDKVAKRILAPVKNRTLVIQPVAYQPYRLNYPGYCTTFRIYFERRKGYDTN